MKIALISSRYPPDVVGGAEKVVQTLAEGLVKQGHHVNILTFAVDGNPRRDQIQGVNIDRILSRNLYPPGKQQRSAGIRAIWHILDSNNPMAAQDVNGWLQEIRPDLVHTHVIAGFSTSIWKSIKTKGIPLIHTIHDHYILCPKTTMFRSDQTCEKQCFDCRMYSLPRLKSTRLVDTVVGVSQYILELHKKLGAFPQSNQVVIYNGVVTSEQPDLQKQFRTNNERIFRFGYLGKINESKGIAKLVNAFLQLAPNQAELWIAGRGQEDLEKELRRLTQNRTDIHWLGFVAPNELLNKVDIIIVPSIWNEPFGMVAIEAMANYIPVIASNRGGLKEIINPGVGWLFDPDQPGALVELIQKVIQSRKEIPVYSANSKEHAKLFTGKRMISAYVNEYEQLLEKRS